MMRKAWVVCVLGMTLLAAAFGQDATLPSREEVLKLMDLLHIKANMVQLTAGMKQSMRSGAEAGLRQKIPNPTPEQLKFLDQLLDPIFQDFPTDEMIEAIVPIYQRHLTRADINEIITFYSSPVGQKLLREQPTMMAEAMKAGQDVMVRRIPEITKRVDAAVQNMTQQNSAGAPVAAPVENDSQTEKK